MAVTRPSLRNPLLEEQTNAQLCQRNSEKTRENSKYGENREVLSQNTDYFEREKLKKGFKFKQASKFKQAAQHPLISLLVCISPSFYFYTILTFLLRSASHINRHLIISLDLVLVCFTFFF